MNDEKKIEQVLSKNGRCVITTSGVSMFPMLRDHRDLVCILPINVKPKKYDVVLFRRGDAYVLHRVVKVLPDRYLIRGDNLTVNEEVTDEQIIGTLSSFVRNGKSHSVNEVRYKIYSRITVWTNPLPIKFRNFLTGAKKRITNVRKT